MEVKTWKCDTLHSAIAMVNSLLTDSHITVIEIRHDEPNWTVVWVE